MPRIEDSERVVGDFLKQLGMAASFVRDANGKVLVCSTGYQGLNFSILIDEFFVCIDVPMFLVPSTNIAPFYRRLLNLNETCPGVFFSINENINGVRCKAVRYAQSLTFEDFRLVIETVAAFSWRSLHGLKQEFGV